MRGGFKLSILAVLFLAVIGIGWVLKPAPAYALRGCTCVATDITCDCIGNKFKEFLIGTSPKAEKQKLYKEGDKEVSDPGAGQSFSSLAEYFEKVWWPRYLQFEAGAVGNQQAFSAGLANMAARGTEAQNQITHMQAQRQMSVNQTVSAMGRTEILCPHPSMGQSALAAEIIADQTRRQRLKDFLNRRNGSTAAQDFALGPVSRKAAMVQNRINLKTCNPTGNAGADKEWCPEGGPADLIDWDQNPEALLETKLLQAQDTNKPTHTQYAQAFIDNMFPEAFFPLRKDLLSGSRSPQVNEVLAEKTGFLTRMAMFARPYHKAYAERTELGNVTAIKSLTAVLERAGYSGEALNRVINNNTTSKAGMDYTRYKIYIEDPQTVISQLASGSTLNLGNAVAFSATMDMNMVSLLYDIREEIKETNRLLGAVGIVSLQPDQRQIQAKIGTASSSAN